MTDQPDAAPPDQGPFTDRAATPEEPRPLNRLPVMIHAQYVKDLSLENPHAPESMAPGAGRPQIDIDFSMDARKLESAEQGDLYEVVLGVEAKASRGDQVAFIVDLQYGVLASLSGVPEDQAHPLLLIEMPRYAFPFVRQIVAELTQSAGFAPLLLAPVDFRDFYLQRYGSQPQSVAQSA